MLVSCSVVISGEVCTAKNQGKRGDFHDCVTKCFFKITIQIKLYSGSKSYLLSVSETRGFFRVFI